MKPDDRLVLTQPLDTGVINTAIKGALASTDVGGLLICIGEEHADGSLEGLVRKGVTESKIMGEVVAFQRKKIVLK